MKARRGRPRKPGPRDAKGRLIPQTDHGTPETQAKRKALVGEADPVLASMALDILLANGFLDADQHQAGERYRRVHWAVYGRSWANHSTSREWPEPCVSGTCSADDCKAVGNRCPAGFKRAYERMVSLLTPEEREVVARVVASNELPMWFCCRRCGLKQLASDHRERDLLLSGLDALAGHTGSARAA